MRTIHHSKRLQEGWLYTLERLRPSQQRIMKAGSIILVESICMDSSRLNCSNTILSMTAWMSISNISRESINIQKKLIISVLIRSAVWYIISPEIVMWLPTRE